MMIENWIKYKIKIYNFYLAKKAKRELYKLLLYKLDENLITSNELEILKTLAVDKEIKNILDPGYIKGVDRNENNE